MVLALGFADDGPRYFLAHFAERLPGFAFVFYIADIHFLHARLHQVHIDQNADIDSVIVEEIDFIKERFFSGYHTAERSREMRQPGIENIQQWFCYQFRYTSCIACKTTFHKICFVIDEWLRQQCNGAFGVGIDIAVEEDDEFVGGYFDSILH